jgi:hypothetical protein
VWAAGAVASGVIQEAETQSQPSLNPSLVTPRGQHVHVKKVQIFLSFFLYFAKLVLSYKPSVVGSLVAETPHPQGAAGKEEAR